MLIQNDIDSKPLRHFTTPHYTADHSRRLSDYLISMLDIGRMPALRRGVGRGSLTSPRYFGGFFTEQTQISRKPTHRSRCRHLLGWTPRRHSLTPLSFYLKGSSVGCIRGSFSTPTSHELIQSKSKVVRTTHVNTLHTFTIHTRTSPKCQANNPKKSPFWRKRRVSQSRAIRPRKSYRVSKSILYSSFLAAIPIVTAISIATQKILTTNTKGEHPNNSQNSDSFDLSLDAKLAPNRLDPILLNSRVSAMSWLRQRAAAPTQRKQKPRDESSTQWTGTGLVRSASMKRDLRMPRLGGIS